MNVFEQACIFAVERHSGMIRKGTQIPYITHPMEAAAIVATMTTDREILAAAVLHDVVEDTPTTLAEIEARFGIRVARLVAAESEDKRPELPASETWKLRKEETIDRLRGTEDPAEKMLVIGDKLSNLRGLQRDYAALGEAVWSRFHVTDKALHRWYYTAIADATKELSDCPAWQEMNGLINSIFG